MAEITAVRAKSSTFMKAEDATEAAVNRLMDTGRSRRDALAIIDQALYKAVHQLQSAGIKQTAFLQQMNLAAGLALNAIKVEEANEDDADRK